MLMLVKIESILDNVEAEIIDIKQALNELLKDLDSLNLQVKKNL